MSGGSDKLERELESFLADDSRVAALYRRLPKDEPDAKLDASILAQARAAAAPRRTRPRWLPAMSAAAAIVIAAGLAYRVGPQVWSERSAVSEKAEPSVAAPASAPQQQPADAAAPNVIQPQAESVASPPPLQPLSGAARSQTDAYGQNQGMIERERRAETDKLHAEKRKVEEQKATANAFAKQSAQQQVRTETLRDRAVSNLPPATSSVQPQRALKSAASPPRLDAAPAAPPPAEASPVTSAVLATPAPKPAGAPKPSAVPQAAAVDYAPAPALPPPAARAPARESAQSVADIESTLYPEHWIADIQQMLKDGRHDDAIRNLAAFRKKYPDYQLPDDLRDLK